jgi:hypothetical protein
MIAKHAKLITVLFFAVMILVLAYLVMSATSCAPLPPESAMQNGTINHPYRLDPDASGQENWNVTTDQGLEFWAIRPGSLAKARLGDDVLYNNSEYQIAGIDQKASTMSAAILGN